MSVASVVSVQTAASVQTVASVQTAVAVCFAHYRSDFDFRSDYSHCFGKNYSAIAVDSYSLHQVLGYPDLLLGSL